MLPLRFQWLPLGGLLTMPLSLPGAVAGAALEWGQLPPLPEPAGVGGTYGGVSENRLVVAGGSNFPDRPPWENGVKRWHDTIYVLADAASGWQAAGKLPRPMGYGVSVSAPAGVVCAGGGDAKTHYADVFVVQWREGKVGVRTLAPLPRPMAYGSGALVGTTLYVAGGLERPDATQTLRTFWALDLAVAKPVWQELEPWPGPARMLAVAGAQGGAFYLASGTELSADAEGKPRRRYLTDVYRYEPGAGWSRRADIPRAAAAAPSPAPVLGSQLLLVLSGDDGSKLGFKPMDQHPGFAKDLLAYDPLADTWSRAGEVPVTQLTVPAVAWQGRFVLPNGEIRPGVRTPQVWTLRSAPGTDKTSF